MDNAAYHHLWRRQAAIKHLIVGHSFGGVFGVEDYGLLVEGFYGHPSDWVETIKANRL